MFQGSYVSYWIHFWLCHYLPDLYSGQTPASVRQCRYHIISLKILNNFKFIEGSLIIV